MGRAQGCSAHMQTVAVSSASGTTSAVESKWVLRFAEPYEAQKRPRLFGNTRPWRRLVAGPTRATTIEAPEYRLALQICLRHQRKQACGVCHEPRAMCHEPRSAIRELAPVVLEPIIKSVRPRNFRPSLQR